MSDKSLTGLVSFLDWTAEKGIMAKNTVNGRKAAVSSVLGILDPEEQGDITEIDLDNVMTRFVNLQGKKYNTSSLNVYKSRTNAAINDFKTWLADPLSFKPNGGKTEKKATPKPAKKMGSAPQSAMPDATSNAQIGQAPQSATANVFPIQIRENLVVRVYGLPFDLSRAEADRIANVVKAMAME